MSKTTSCGDWEDGAFVEPVPPSRFDSKLSIRRQDVPQDTTLAVLEREGGPPQSEGDPMMPRRCCLLATAAGMVVLPLRDVPDLYRSVRLLVGSR